MGGLLCIRVTEGLLLGLLVGCIATPSAYALGNNRSRRRSDDGGRPSGGRSWKGRLLRTRPLGRRGGVARPRGTWPAQAKREP